MANALEPLPSDVSFPSRSRTLDLVQIAQPVYQMHEARPAPPCKELPSQPNAEIRPAVLCFPAGFLCPTCPEQSQGLERFLACIPWVAPSVLYTLVRLSPAHIVDQCCSVHPRAPRISLQARSSGNSIVFFTSMSF